MTGQLNSKITGSIVIGFALVAGAYVVSNFGKADIAYQAASLNISTTPPVRVSIETGDSDANGIEDWRDQFLTADAIEIDNTITEYVPNNTLTEKMSIGFMEGIMSNRIYAPFGKSDEETIEKTVEYLARETAQKLYSTSDIIIMDDWTEEDVVNYTNTAAATIYRNSNSDLRGELNILNEQIRNQTDENLEELKLLSEVYANYRDDTLKIPVPAILAKEHLDLINTYEAIYYDIYAMSIYSSDPAVALLRLQRYEGDATSLGRALQNIYYAIEPYSALFTAQDPGLLFAAFSSEFQI